MRECAHEPVLSVREAQNAVDIGLRQLVEERMVRLFVIARILQRPAAISLELEVRVRSRGDAPVDL